MDWRLHLAHVADWVPCGLSMPIGRSPKTGSAAKPLVSALKCSNFGWFGLIWGTPHLKGIPHILHIKLKRRCFFSWETRVHGILLVTFRVLNLAGTVCLEDSRCPTGRSRFVEPPGGVTIAALVHGRSLWKGWPLKLWIILNWSSKFKFRNQA